MVSLGSLRPRLRITDGSPGILLLALLVSSLLHLLLIYLAAINGVAGAARSDLTTAQVGRISLAATLRKTEDVVHPEHFSDKVEVLQGYRYSENDRSRLTPPSVPDRWFKSLIPYETVYFSADELTVQPRSLGEPAFDPTGFANSASGQMILKLWISAQGEVVEASIERSGLPDGFSTAVIGAFRRLRFEPGELNGLPVRSVIKVEVDYSAALDRFTH